MSKPVTQDSMRHDPLSTGHLLSNLGHRTASNALVSTIAQGIRFATNLTSTLVLARLLTPHDFGLVAMVYAVTGFLEVFKEAGLSTATVQRQDITQAQVSNLFWANVGIGTVITLLVMALAPALAWFYHEPRLVPVTVALASSFLLTASAVQHQAILRRQMRFATVATIQIVSAIVGLVVAISMASADCAYWSLVGSTLSAAVCNCVVTWLCSNWRPGLPVRGVGTRSLFRFGAHLTGAAIMSTVMGTADTLLIGRFYGPDALGLYSRGAALMMNPLGQFLSPFNAVLIPTLSRLQSEADRYRRTFLQILQTIALLALPLTGFLLASAQPLVLVLMGEKWSAAIPLFSAFSFAAIYFPFASASNWLFTSQGRGREVFVASSVTAVLALVSIVAGLPFGPIGVALSYSISGLVVRLPIFFYYAGRRGPVHTRDLWHCLFTNLPLGALAFCATYATCWFLHSRSALIQLCVSAPICITAVGLFVLVSPSHRRTATDAANRLRAMLANRLNRTPLSSSLMPTGKA